MLGPLISYTLLSISQVPPLLGGGLSSLSCRGVFSGAHVQGGTTGVMLLSLLLLYCWLQDWSSMVVASQTGTEGRFRGSAEIIELTQGTDYITR